MPRSVEQAEQLTAAWRERVAAVEPLRKMLSTGSHRFTREREDRKGNDDAVVAVARDLRSLARRTKRWMRWAERSVLRQEEQADQADEASLQGALSEIKALASAAQELAEEAAGVLDVARRAALGRYMISERTQADRLWGPAVKEDPSRARKLDWFVEQEQELFLDRDYPEVVTNRLPAGTNAPYLPDILRRPTPRASLPENYPLLRLWQSLHLQMQSIEIRAWTIDEVHERVQHVYEQAVERRHRAESEAEQLRRQAAREAEQQERAQEADRLAAQAARLAERIEAYRNSWGLSSRELREREWTSLRKELCEGLRNDDGQVVVSGIPQQQAADVLALLKVASEHGDQTPKALEELLATEDELIDERARLYESTAQLRVHVPAEVSDLHPVLRRASEWLAENLSDVTPALAAQAPEAARALDDAIRKTHGTSGG